MLEQQMEVMEILLAEDDEGDIRFIQECLKHSTYKVNLNVVHDGGKVMEYLKKTGEYAKSPRPHLIFLDLNMPRKDGREALAEIKADYYLRNIPVVVLTTSESRQDLIKLYSLGANCYVTKPMDFDRFCVLINELLHFWFSVAKLPTGDSQGRM